MHGKQAAAHLWVTQQLLEHVGDIFPVVHHHRKAIVALSKLELPPILQHGSCDMRS